MKKIIVASDLHGSGFYTKKLMAAAAREKAERMLLLGDLLYHGARNDLPKGYAPKEVIALLTNAPCPISAVRGNCDSEVDQMVLAFPIIADYALMMVGERTYFVTHGHHYNLSALPPLGPGDILLHGHTHVPNWTPFGTDHWVLNPGSVTLPKENSPHSYLVIKGSKVTWKTLDGEIFHEMDLTNY